MAQVRVTVDGVNYADDVEPRMLLVYYLRERLGKTGTLVGCDTSNCGACTVHLNGQSVKSCSVLAVQADGGEVTTIEGVARDGKLHPVQEAFHENHALQCGYCTPGMIMQSIDLLSDNPDPTEDEVREGIEGNLCRCTGYQNIVKAVQSAAQKMKPGAPAETPDHGRSGPVTAVAEPGLEVGKARVRKEDARLITGRSRYTDAITPPGTLHLHVVRSPVAHATITGIDASAAKQAPGVIGVYTAADLGVEAVGLPCAWPITPGHEVPAAAAARHHHRALRR